MNIQCVAVGLLYVSLANNAAADVEFSFVESAPKDSFRIMNRADCELGVIEVIIDLSGSAGNLVFDTSESGAGVEVYQPFELVRGEARVQSATPLSDGDKMVHMTLSNLGPGEEVVFTIDVDDQLDDGELGQIRVSGSEISGASATVISSSIGAVSGVYGEDGRAVAAYSHCL